jgi:uncharacterized protein
MMAPGPSGCLRAGCGAVVPILCLSALKPSASISAYADRLLWPALLALLAGLGYFLVTITPVVAAHYRETAAGHRVFSMVYLGMVAAGGLLLLFVWGIMVYTVVSRMRQVGRSRRLPPPSALSPAQKERELRKRLEAAERAAERAEAREATSAGVEPGAEGKGESHELRQSVETLKRKIEKKTLEIVAFGAVSSGKSSLLNALLGEERFATDPRGGTTLGAQEVPLPMSPGASGVGGGGGGAQEGRIILRDTPGLGEVLGGRRARAAAEHAAEADLVLLVVSGALRDFEFEALRALVAMEKRVLICLNKEDWYTPQDFETVRKQLREQVHGMEPWVTPDDVIPVRAKPSVQKRIRELPDGTTREEDQVFLPDIGALEARLRTVVRKNGPDLLLANLLLRSRGVAARARAVAKGK